MKSIIYFASLTLLCSCSTKAPEAAHRFIAPLPAGVSVDNLQDCTIPIAFTLEDFNWMGGNLTMKVFNMDLYDVVDISQMQVGDTILYNRDSVVINTINKDHGVIDINGGIDEGGCCLAGYEGGTYVARFWDDHATYTELGKAEVALAEDFILIDCGSFPEDPSDTIRTDQKLYIENLEDGRKDFYPLNTRVTIENGMITEINRHWIP